MGKGVGHPRKSVGDEQVQAVQCRGANPHPDVVGGPDVGGRDLGQGQVRQPPHPLEDEGAHEEAGTAGRTCCR